MTFTEIYFALLICILIYCIVERKGMVGLVLLSLYSFVGLFSILVVKDNSILRSLSIDAEEITLTPYIFLIVCYVIFFWPFLKGRNGFIAEKQVGEVNNTYIILGYVYIICSAINLLTSLTTIIEMLQSANWAVTYSESSVVTYTNIVQYLSAIVCSYFRILALVIGFSLLTMDNTEIEEQEKKVGKKEYVFSLLLIFCSVGTGICHAILSTSRSMIYEYMILLLLASIFSFKRLKKNIRSILVLAFIAIAGFALLLFISVTVSRFETRGIYDSVISYIGQSPVVFNTQIMNTVDKFLHGNYTLGILVGNTNFSQSSIGGKWGSSFYTFVGWLYIDWGPVGTIIIGLLVSYFLTRIVKKQEYLISDLFLLFSYLDLMIKGVFVIGRSQCYSIAGTVLIYIVLRAIFDRYIITIGSWTIGHEI